MKDTCVLITGATKGIGWALSRRLADQGCHVVGIARNTAEIDFPGYLYECDLSDAGQTEDVLRVIREKFPVDAVVNNVGAAVSQPLGGVELSALFETFDLNVRTAVQVTQAFVESMKVQRAGRIVNLCSLSVRGARDATSYAAAKSAIIGVMLESHLVAGSQTVVPGQALTYGQSITDGCIAFADTVPVLRQLAQAVEARRVAAA